MAADDLEFALARIREGARIRVATDFFGQTVLEVPRRWLPGSVRIKLSPSQMDEVKRALMVRRSERSRRSAA